MRSTIVPAQVTTVEDKIAGSLGVSQLLLLTLPVFGGSLIFVAVPPFLSYATYKIVAIVCFAVVCGTLALRIKGKILLFWIISIVRYNTRPRYYIFDKNDSHLRPVVSPKQSQGHEKANIAAKKSVDTPLKNLSIKDLVAVESVMSNPNANLRFTTNKKGGLSVHITEIQ